MGEEEGQRGWERARSARESAGRAGEKRVERGGGEAGERWAGVGVAAWRLGGGGSGWQAREWQTSEGGEGVACASLALACGWRRRHLDVRVEPVADAPLLVDEAQGEGDGEGRLAARRHNVNGD